MADAFINEVATFDKCGGHVDISSNYHVHEHVGDGCGYNN